MELKNRLTENKILEQAYDIFLALASDNLASVNIFLFNLQLEQRSAAELYSPLEV